MRTTHGHLVTACISVGLLSALPTVACDVRAVPFHNVVLRTLERAARSICAAALVHVSISAISIIAMYLSGVYAILVPIWAIEHTASTFFVGACVAVK